MKREIFYHPKAGADARDLAAYYEAISPELAESFWLELLESIECARLFPERHHFDETGRRRANLNKFPVHFLFRIFPDFIRITVIRHDRRNPDHGSGRK